jgi:hypothetical protein
MAPTTRRPGAGEIDETPGLAGGPGPTPPGIDDGTAEPRRAKPEPPPSAAAQQAEGEAAERSAAVRRADVPSLAGEREGRGAEGAPGADDDGGEGRRRR